MYVEDTIYKFKLLKSGDIITFNSSEIHGVLPIHIAENIVTSQNLDDYLNWLHKYNHKLCPVKIV